MKAIIILVVLFWLPLIATAQTDPFSDIVDSLSPAAKATKYELVVPKKPKFKGWYFGLNTGLDYSLLRYEIPEDPYTGYTGTNTNDFIFGEDFKASLGSRVIVQANAKYVVGKVLTIDFTNQIKEDGGDIKMYEEYSGRWSLSSRYEPREIYHLKLITNHFTVTPNLTLGSPKFNMFFGVGFGCSNVLSRKGNLGDSLQFRTLSVLYKVNIGFNTMIKGGIASLTLSGNRTGNAALRGWNAYIGFNALTIGYALPISAFKRKPKTATDPNS
jgi:hypothetical protein